MSKVLASLATIAALTAVAEAAPWFDVPLGQNGDIPVVRDYNNDGRSDYAVWRPATGMWMVKDNKTLIERQQQWGVPTDVPVPADFTGDNYVDYVVWRPTDGVWYVRNALTGYWWGQQWGQLGDIPVPGDYTNDGHVDYAVYRPSTGTWYVLDGVSLGITTQQWGMQGDVPIAGDFDGRPGFDYTVFRPSTGEWLTFGPLTRRQQANYRWGGTGDVALAANLGCGAKAGQTIYRNGTWWSFGLPVRSWGYSTDLPVPANYTGDDAADHAIYRPSEGKFYVVENDQNVRPCAETWYGARAAVDASKEQVQGVTVAAVKNGAIVWSYGAGMANDYVPATPDVPWQLASISKLFIATAALRELDQNHLQLDTPAGLTNPFTFQNPTLRQFANHTATVRKDVCTYINGVDPVSNLAMVLNPCFFTWPNNLFTWENRQIGVVSDYSNLGAAWPARMVEMATGRDFAEYTRTEIFTKLGMTSTAWFASAFAGQSIAQAYYAPNHPSTMTFGVSPYAIGNLRSTANDLARFMILWTSGGTAFGNTIVSPARVTMALTSTAPSDMGFFWMQRGGGRWTHNGVLDGICTRLTIDPATREGVVVLTNGRCAEADPRIDAIETAAFDAM